MNTKINLLLDQKHLLNEIDFYIFTSFLDENEITELMDLFDLKEASLEEFLNTLPKIGKISHQKTFIQYLKFRQRILDKEKEFFKKILQSVEENEKISESSLT